MRLKYSGINSYKEKHIINNTLFFIKSKFA
jgi:hypothetical protein